MTTRSAREAWRAILDLVFEGEAQGRIQQACAALGVSPGALKALFHLRPAEGVPMRDLAQHWGCDASYVTTLADALEERGLAVRRSHPTDRRVKMLVLTARGRAARERGLELLYQPPRCFGALTPAEQRQRRDLLARVAAADPGLPGHRTAAS